MSNAQLVHATTVAIGGAGVMIAGPPGSGKSDLALRLIDRGARLVADDQTLVRNGDGGLVASAPASIRGKLEVRGLGILSVEPVDAPVALRVALGDSVERMPERRTSEVAGVAVREIMLDPRSPSAAIKVELALAHPEMVIA